MSSTRPRDFWAHVHEPRRGADFERVFATRTVAITAPIPHLATLPGFPEPQPVYLLDLEWVSEQGHREKLVAFIAERFEQDPAFVDAHLEAEGMPILAADVTVRIDHPQRWA